MHSIKILFQVAFFGGLPRFRLAGVSDVAPSPTSSWGEVGLGFRGLPLLRFVAGSPITISSGALLSCVNHRGSERAVYGASSAEQHTLGLPLFLFSPAAGAASDVDAAVSAALFGVSRDALRGAGGRGARCALWKGKTRDGFRVITESLFMLYVGPRTRHQRQSCGRE